MALFRSIMPLQSFNDFCVEKFTNITAYLFFENVVNGKFKIYQLQTKTIKK